MKRIISSLLAALMAFGLAACNAEKTAQTTAETIQATVAEEQEGVFAKESYTVSGEEALDAAQTVVATVNGRKLTNGALQIYYKMQVVDFFNTNASYLAYMGLDISQPLSQQVCYYDETVNWEQYFVNIAVETWLNYQWIYSLTVEAGYMPTEDLRTSLEQLPGEIDKLATQEGFESGEAFIQDRFGPASTVEDYVSYCRMMYVCSEYINVQPTDQELEDFYTENEAYFVDNGVDKESGPMVNVRHILLEPHVHEEEATEPTGETESTDPTEETYSEEAWADCLQHAEDLLAQWKEGEATEESFAALANEYSADGGSNTTGGLYTGITATTSFVPEFLEWCMDESHQIGDTGIVRTDYGYHIMYFAYTQPLWKYYATQYYLSDRTDQLLASAKEKWPTEIDYTQIALPELDLQ